MADDDEVAELYFNWKLETLKELRPYLVSNLEPHKLFAHLRSVEVLDESDQEEIEGERTRRKKTEVLLDIIGKRGADGFDSFCESICKNKTQLFILRKILDCFQRKKDHFYGDSSAQQCNDRQLQDLPIQLPVPGQPGGPSIPAFERPADNIAAVQGSQGRSHSPPPAYSDIYL